MVSRLLSRYRRGVYNMRKRSSLFDHFWRTQERYGEVLGGRLSAAIAYYGFFATFALAAVGYTIAIKIFSNNAELVSQVDSFLAQYFTTLDTAGLKEHVNNVQTIGLISLVLAGVGWVDAWRSSIRAVWRLDQHPGNPLLLRLADLGTLVIFSLMLIISLGVTDGLERLYDWILGDASGTIWFRAGVQGLVFAINVAIAFGLMTVLPRVSVSARRLMPSLFGIAVGLTVLNAAGRLIVMRTEITPAYAIVASSVGLLVYLYLFNQIVIWATAWAATANGGRVLDLAWGRPRESETLDNILK